MLVFVLGTGMNITSTFNTVDVRAASVKLNKTNVNLVKGQTLQLKLQEQRKSKMVCIKYKCSSCF